MTPEELKSAQVAQAEAEARLASAHKQLADLMLVLYDVVWMCGGAFFLPTAVREERARKIVKPVLNLGDSVNGLVLQCAQLGEAPNGRIVLPGDVR